MGGETRRLFAPSLPPAGGEVTLDGQAAHHARVLRLAPGDPVRLFDGQGAEAAGTIARAERDAVVCEVGPAVRVADEGPRVVLVQAMAKGDKLDGIVRMATEIGVCAIHLAETERTVSRPDARRAARRVERLSRVAREAARQARRAQVPEVRPPAALSDVASRPPEGALRLLLWERAEQALDTVPFERTAEVWLGIGPEGGLSEAEAATLQQAGWRAVGLGPTVLRVETAAPVAVALVMDHLGLLRPDGKSR